MSALRNPFRKTVKSVSKPATAAARAPLKRSAAAEESHHRIKKIVLTGGPCGGKSSGMSHISEFLRGLTSNEPFFYRSD